MKILNLYAGLGGNRKLWGNEHEIIAVENNYEIAQYYEKHYPNDGISCDDVIDILEEWDLDEYDFIWASPPCQTHSRMRNINTGTGTRQTPPRHPDLTSLYGTIIFLNKYYHGLYCIENVIPYYTPLIKPSVTINRHHFWSNFIIPHIIIPDDDFNIKSCSNERYGINIKDYKMSIRKDQLIRNCVHPKIGKYILDCAMKKIKTLDDYL